MRLLSFGVAFASLLLLGAASVAQTIDPDASVVHLRTTCTIDDCFDDTDDLTAWLWGGSGRTNPPSANDRVTIHVGPGDFDPFLCDGSATDRGYVSVIGSGRQQSRFVRVAGGGAGTVNGACRGGINIENCQKMDFSHLAGVGSTGILWMGGGFATWSDVDMIGEKVGGSCGGGALGWYDVPGAGGRSLHYMFGSRAIARSPHLNIAAFDALNAEVWFYGGDIVAEVRTTNVLTAAGVIATDDADVRLFGTTVRAQVDPGNPVLVELLGAWVTNGGMLHIHGGIINASADQGSGNINAYAIKAEDSGTHVHTPGTAFVVKAKGTGVATRVSATGGAMVESPYVWPADTAPPAAVAPHGSDAFVETDRGTGSNEAHLMVRDSSCTGGGGNWRDMATGACR